MVDKAVAALRAGQLVGLPTETVYGLAARGDDADAVRRIFAAKGRPSNNPLILHVADIAGAKACFSPGLWGGGEQGRFFRERFECLARFWPGPITLVGPKHERIPSIVTAGLPTVGVRVPKHPLALELLRRCEFPLAAPSANPSNYVSPTNAEHVRASLGDRVAVVLDGGECEVGVESTIVDLGFREITSGGVVSSEEDVVRILRPGGITLEQIREVLPAHKIESQLEENMLRPTSPGQFAKHYSPSTPVVSVGPMDCMLEASAERPTQRVLRLAMSRESAERCRGYAEVWTLSSGGDLEEIARRLYDFLRRADESGFDRIDIEQVPSVGIGKAIEDRLRRCASR